MLHKNINNARSYSNAAIAFANELHPIAFGEQLLTERRERGIKVEELAKEHGFSRVTCSKYLSMALWPEEVKEFAMRKRIKKTHLMLAANNFKRDAKDDLLEFLKNAHETDGKMTAEIINLETSYKTHVNPESENVKAEKATVNMPSFDVNSLFTKIIDARFTLLMAVFYVFLIPVSAEFFKSVSSGIVSTPLFTSDIYPYLLAAAVDATILLLLRSASWPKMIIGALLLVLNSFGAYFLSAKNFKNSGISERTAEIAKIKNEVKELKSTKNEKYAAYLTVKWPGESEPTRCEKTPVECKAPFISKAEPARKDYIKASQDLETKENDLQNAEKTELPIKAEATDAFVHWVYYLFGWLFIVLLCWLKQSQQAENSKLKMTLSARDPVMAR